MSVTHNYLVHLLGPFLTISKDGFKGKDMVFSSKLTSDQNIGKKNTF